MENEWTLSTRMHIFMKLNNKDHYCDRLYISVIRIVVRRSLPLRIEKEFILLIKDLTNFLFKSKKMKKIWLQILIMSFILSFSLINNHLTRSIFYAVNNVTGTGAKGVFFLKLWNLFCKMSENQEQLLHFSYFLSKVKPTATEKRQGKPNGACGHLVVKIIR